MTHRVYAYHKPWASKELKNISAEIRQIKNKREIIALRLRELKSMNVDNSRAGVTVRGMWQFRQQLRDQLHVLTESLWETKSRYSKQAEQDFQNR